MSDGNIHRAVRLLKALGVRTLKIEDLSKYSIAKQNFGGKVDVIVAECPFARYKHPGKVDRHPSFRVTLTGDGKLIYNCFGCGVSGRLYDLPTKLAAISKEFNYQAQEIATDILSSETDVEFDDFKKRTTDLFIPISKKLDSLISLRQRVSSAKSIAVPRNVLENFPRLRDSNTDAAKEVLSWLVEIRKIDVGVIEKYGLRLYSNSGNLGVVFPIVGFDNRIYDLWVRLINTKSFFRITPRSMNCGVAFGTKGLVFGLNHISWGGNVIIVEGAIDALRLMSLGSKIPAVATMGPPTTFKLLSIPATTVFLGFDADDAGRDFARKALSYFAKSVRRVFLLDWGLVGRKDAGELQSSSELKSVFSNAELVYSVQNYEKIQYKLPKIC